MSAEEIANQKHNLPLLVTRETVSGGTYIVTGANVGLGFEAANHLASLGAAKVILGVRNTAAGEAAKAKIDAAAGTAEAGVVEVWPLDLSSYDSVKAFAKRAATELDRIDALIENAGVALAERTLAEGHIVPITVNVLGTLLLASLLLPEISRKGKQFGIVPHVVIVSSRAGFTNEVRDAWSGIKADPLTAMDAEGFPMIASYPLSKLIETVAVRHLARELIPVAKTGVVVNLVCPGLCSTTLLRNAPADLVSNISQQLTAYGRTAEDGSRTLLHGAVAGVESHGLFLHSCENGEKDVPDWVKDDTETQKRVWEIVAKELEIAEPGVVERLLQTARV